MADVLPTGQSIPYLQRSPPYYSCHCMYLIVTHPISTSRPVLAESSRATPSHRRHAASRPRNLGQRTQRGPLAHLRRAASYQSARQASQHTKARPFSAPKQKKPHPHPPRPRNRPISAPHASGARPSRAQDSRCAWVSGYLVPWSSSWGRRADRRGGTRMRARLEPSSRALDARRANGFQEAG
jgi:hypothetical protein